MIDEKLVLEAQKLGFELVRQVDDETFIVNVITLLPNAGKLEDRLTLIAGRNINIYYEGDEIL